MTLVFNNKFLAMLLLAYLQILNLLPESHGKVVNYTLEISYFTGAPDGVWKNEILGINGQFPGPTLEANVGDTLEITLINSIQDGQNTTIHWHGIHQQGSLFEDGTSMIAQCPLPPGNKMVYRFNVTQPGTFWYHSHVNSQYTEGMVGALIVHGTPEAYRYDGEITLQFSDWYHETAHENEAWHLSPASGGIAPYPYSGLVNGMGRYPCHVARRLNRTCSEVRQLRPVFRVERNKVYRVRVINTAAIAAFNFSIDHLQLRTIEVDGMDVARPVAADIVPIAAGQRYSFLVQCRTDIPGRRNRYLMRANLRKEVISFREGENINKHPEALIGDITAVLECGDENLSHKKNFLSERLERFTWADSNPPMPGGDLQHIDEMELRPLDGIPAPRHFDTEYMVSAGFQGDHNGVRRGSFNATPFVLPHDTPLLMKLIEGESLPNNVFPLDVPYGGVVQLVINNPFFGPHPFHLHGHHFWVVGAGKWSEGNYDSSRHSLRLDGVKRDTVLVQEHSWAVIRFVADNPGVWVFHCHIDWHNLSGMALTFVEGADIVKNTTRITDEALRVCKLHN